MNYNQLKSQSEQLIENNKQKYSKIILDKLEIKISEKDMSELLKLEYLPIYLKLKSIYENKNDTTFLGIVGVNGSGKTTLSKFLKILLESEKFRVVHFSMDDLYPTKEKRKKLAEKIDPNLKTRLMYDNNIVKRVFEDLKNWKESTKIPQFDKGIDDRLPKDQWLNVDKKPDFVIMEGAFTFAKAIDEKNLSKADQFINRQVRKIQDTYNFIDLKLALLTDSIENVIEFRKEQEIKLQKKRGKKAGMSLYEVERFVRYFQTYLERYTWPKEQDPEINLVFTIDQNRRISKVYSPKNDKTYLD